MEELTNRYSTKTGQEIIEVDFAEDLIIPSGSNLLIGNGYLGYRGIEPNWEAAEFSGCIVSDTYDQADGKWRELVNAPNGLYFNIIVDDQPLEKFPGRASESESLIRLLDLRSGLYNSKRKFNLKGTNFILETKRFASLKQLELIPAKYSLSSDRDLKIKIQAGIDKKTWDLNGRHLNNFKEFKQENLLSTTAQTVESKIKVAVSSLLKMADNNLNQEYKLINKDDKYMLEIEINLKADEPVEFEQFMVVTHSNQKNNPLQASQKIIKEAEEAGFNFLYESQLEAWNKIWDSWGLEIGGPLKDQTLINFNLYHNRIATPAYSERLPIGARGLSCQAYQGAAFWDQEIFNLPVFLYTEPEIAKNILKYRYHTLPGARKKAKDLGYKGAFYAWISGKTGEELCPDFFFEDVLTGRKIRNHFNDWQIHISPDIAYTVWHYYQATGDIDFIVNYGSEVIFEIARFLYSRAHFNKNKKEFELIRLLGPDEYHENVDNNVFTLYQSKYALEKALIIYKIMERDYPDRLKILKDKIELKAEEVANWKELASLIKEPGPDLETGLIEQHDGYFDLEDTTPEVLEERLQDPGEYWGWPNGVAHHTQVIKQADLIQLFWLQPDLFSQEIKEKNLDYYLKRTEHGSSLSPSAYAIEEARQGRTELARQRLIDSASIDLENTNKAVSGGTFIGGIHTAACGASWQVLTFGFAGLSFIEAKADNIYPEIEAVLNPEIPAAWDYYQFNLKLSNQDLTIRVETDTIIITASKNNHEEVKIKIGEESIIVAPGITRKIRR
ncbi:MAG: glycosyl hydrolase family 65 protein [Bacillota bacterium]